jgi:hypothetical protein
MFGFTKSPPKMTDLEQKMYKVIETMVMSPDCIIEINPDDMSYMLSIEDEGYYLLLDDVGVQFSNHGFIIIKSYESKILDHYKTAVKIETTRRRNLRKSEIFKNEGNLLISISDKLTIRKPVPAMPGFSADV